MLGFILGLPPEPGRASGPTPRREPPSLPQSAPGHARRHAGSAACNALQKVTQSLCLRSRGGLPLDIVQPIDCKRAPCQLLLDHEASSNHRTACSSPVSGQP